MIIVSYVTMTQARMENGMGLAIMIQDIEKVEEAEPQYSLVPRLLSAFQRCNVAMLKS